MEKNMWQETGASNGALGGSLENRFWSQKRPSQFVPTPIKQQ